VQIADEDHGQGPYEDHCPLAHALDKRAAETERSPGRSGVVDDHGLPPPGELEEVRDRDPNGRVAVHHWTTDRLGRMLRSGTASPEIHDAAKWSRRPPLVTQADFPKFC
jgi:hypothetical protein